MAGGEAREVSAGVYLVGGPGITDPSDCLIYAVDGEEEIALVDCGAGRSVVEILENLDRLGLGAKPIAALILTHCHVDHIGGAGEFLRKRAATVVCHRGDLEAIESGDPRKTASSWYGVRLPGTRVDRVLEEEQEVLEVGSAKLQCIHTPGHTPGSISVVWERPEGKVLFGQDIHGPFMEEFGSDLAQWASSMRKLLALKADLLCEGHFGTFQPATEVEGFILRQLREHGF